MSYSSTRAMGCCGMGGLDANGLNQITGTATPSTVTDLQVQLNRFAVPAAGAFQVFSSPLPLTAAVDSGTVGRTIAIGIKRASDPTSPDAVLASSIAAAMADPANLNGWVSSNITMLTGMVRGYADINHVPSADGMRTVMYVGIAAALAVGYLVFSGNGKGRRKR